MAGRSTEAVALPTEEEQVQAEAHATAEAEALAEAAAPSEAAQAAAEASTEAEAETPPPLWEMSTEQAEAALAEAEAALAAAKAEAGADGKVDRLLGWAVTKARRAVAWSRPEFQQAITDLVADGKASIEAAAIRLAEAGTPVPGVIAAGTRIETVALPDGVEFFDSDGNPVTEYQREVPVEAEQDFSTVTGMVSRLLVGRRATG